MRTGPGTALVMVVALLVPWAFGQGLNVPDDSEKLKSIREVASLDERAVTMSAAVPQPATAAIEPSPSPQTDAKLLVITVPEGGSVRSLSDNHLCGAGETCENPDP